MMSRNKTNKDMIPTIKGVVPHPRVTLPASELSDLKKYCKGAVFFGAKFDRDMAKN
jgi:hypothetical protein